MKATLAAAAAVLLIGCDAPPTFTDVTAGSGIVFQYTYGDDTYENIIESSGSGVTAFDYDGDGYLDLMLLNGTYLEGISDPEGKVYEGSLDRLYRNRGDGTFEEATAGIADSNWTMAAGAADFDRDGDQDLLLLNYGPNVFYRNNGDGTFSEEDVGLAGPDSLNGFPKWSVGAAMWDYDLDGRVDVMVCNFLAFDPVVTSENGGMPHPGQYHGQASILYRQEDDGHFTDVTADLGLHYPESRCMGLSLLDFDDDGDLDLFQANDHQPNFLFRWDGGLFEEVGSASGVAVNDEGVGAGSMHGTPGDVDGDGRVDLLVVDLEHGALYRNAGGGLFTDITRASGAARAFTGIGAWAAALFDFDNDGDLDVFSANGRAEELVLQPPLLLENDGSGNLTDRGRSFGPYFAGKRSGRGAAVWDYDNDGDRDVVVSHLDGKAALLRNDGGHRNHWIGFRFADAADIGALVSVYAGGRRRVALNQWTTGYLSSNDPRVHVGLGSTSRVDSIRIRWPGGEVETRRGLDADRYHDVTRTSSSSSLAGRQARARP